MNNNQREGFGALYTSYLIGKVSEYCKVGDLFGHLADLIEHPDIISCFEEKVASVESWETKQFSSLWEFRAFRIILHVLVRDMRPDLVVETGVLHGMTSGFVLDAMAKNDHGRLLSIDLPSYFDKGAANNDGYQATLPKSKEPGWIIPEHLCDRWDLRKGKSVELLRSMEDEIGDIDLFCHDSEHTYSTMWQELCFAWDHLSPRGILVCDNVEANSSFYDFCRRVNRSPLVLPTPSENVLYAPRFALIRRN